VPPTQRIKFLADLYGAQILRSKQRPMPVCERHAHLRLDPVRPHRGLERARRIRRPAFRHGKLKHHFADRLNVLVEGIEGVADPLDAREVDGLELVGESPGHGQGPLVPQQPQVLR